MRQAQPTMRQPPKRGRLAVTQRPEVRSFFHAPTNTVSYLVFDVSTHEGALIDPVLDFELATGEVGVQFVERVLKAAAELGVRLAWTLETHAHADHLSASAYVRARTRARIGIG